MSRAFPLISPTSFIVFLSFALPAAAQLPPGDLVVLAEAKGAVRSTLELVDRTTGATTAFGRFPSDGLPPRALAWDPIADELIVALAEGNGTKVVRLRCQGTTVVGESTVHRLADAVEDLVVDDDGRLFAAIGGAAGGLVELGRRTDDRRSVAMWPHVGSLDVPSPGFGVSVQSVPLGDPRLAFVDLASGVFQSGPHVVPGLTGVTLTDAIDLPTTAIMQLLSDDQGRLHLFELLSTTRTLPIQPALPPGGTQALLAGRGHVWVLGGAASPYLRELALFQWTSLQTVAGPLANDPVDLVRTAPVGPEVRVFGEGCGAASYYWRDQPSLGSTQFSIGLSRGMPNTPALLLLGASEATWLGAPLPNEIFPGCHLWVSADVPLPTGPTNGFGATEVALPIPNHSELLDVRVYGQWFQSQPPAILTTPAVAVRIGP